jgi:hypothetical protein
VDLQKSLKRAPQAHETLSREIGRTATHSRYREFMNGIQRETIIDISNGGGIIDF